MRLKGTMKVLRYALGSFRKCLLIAISLQKSKALVGVSHKDEPPRFPLMLRQRALVGYSNWPSNVRSAFS